ncbi:hypothetical protein [uncultured Gimesia sp.]|uniref:hypothetical protein n=1 Tax=uncultured Gimesia sp. TaxID=1678688 RepID=UPI00262B5FA6|nr:hypothetical protein [uncultured Gimesia sp.]
MNTKKAENSLQVILKSRQKNFGTFCRIAGKSSDLSLACQTQPMIDERLMSARAIINTPREDREGDIIVPRGVHLENFRKNPVVLWEHGLGEITRPIAKCQHPDGNLALEVEEHQISATSYFTDKSLESLQIFHLIVEGLVKDIARRHSAGEQLGERDIRRLDETGQGQDIVRDYRSNQGIAAGGESVLMALSSGFRDARDKEIESTKIAARAEMGERDLQQTLPGEAQRQNELRANSEEKKRAMLDVEQSRDRQLRQLNESEYQEEQTPIFNRIPNPFVLPERAAPSQQRQPDQRAAANAADAVTRSGIEVDQALKIVLEAVAANQSSMVATIESSKLMEKSYA